MLLCLLSQYLWHVYIHILFWGFTQLCGALYYSVLFCCFVPLVGFIYYYVLFGGFFPTLGFIYYSVLFGGVCPTLWGLYVIMSSSEVFCPNLCWVYILFCPLRRFMSHFVGLIYYYVLFGGLCPTLLG